MSSTERAEHPAAEAEETVPTAPAEAQASDEGTGLAPSVAAAPSVETASDPVTPEADDGKERGGFGSH